MGLAIEAASRALPDWSATPAGQRAQVMYAYRDLVKTHLSELAEIVASENPADRLVTLE